jgi:hypothetical protein
MILLLLDIRWNYLTFLVEVSTTWPHPHNASEILLTVGRYLTFISITYEKTLAMSIYFWDKFLAFSTDLPIMHCLLLINILSSELFICGWRNECELIFFA